MKKYVSLILVTAMLTAAFSLCLSFLKLDNNPFAFYDEERFLSIENALRTNVEDNGPDNKIKTESGYIVKFNNDVDLEDVYECVKGYSFKLLADSNSRLFKLCIDDLDAFKAAYSDIVYDIEAERALTLSATVDDPLAGDQWELEFLEAYSAWDITTGNSDVTVAVLDSGVYRRHPDFEGVSILAGYDAVDRVNVINVDHNGHGTKVISILAAAANNGQGMAGVGRNISILPIRVSDYTGYIHSADFIEAIYYAADAGVDIINMSFGGYSYSAMEEAAMEYASSKGCLLISAAGNKETDAGYAGMKAYPASYSSVISVGAVDENGVICPFSQRNDAVDMVAPGYNVTVANMDDGYEKELGTSFACAYVSAVAALALSAIDEGIGFTAEQFVSLVSLLNGGKRDDGYGYGVVNALQIVSGINTPLVSGVTNGGVYHKNVTVTFNRGSAILDDKPFYSGESVITSGSHTLVVTDGDNELTINFITDNIPLKYDYKVNSDNAVITFNRGTATLDGAPYLSGTPIKAEGRHFFMLTGPYGNTESFEFKCDFKAPQIFGVENGVLYTQPVYITAERGGTLTLNGKLIPSGTVVSKSGGYTLVSSNADGSAKKTVYFTVSLNKVSHYNAAVSDSMLIADELYKTLIFYNNALSGIRVFTWGNLINTRCFVRTESGVTGYGFTKKHLVLMHTDGVTLCDRSAIAAGNTGDVISYSFDKKAVATAFMDGFVYYIVNEASNSTLYRMNTSNGKSTVLTSVDKSARFLCCDGNSIVVATAKGEVFVYSLNGALTASTDIGSEITNVATSGGYICTNGFVYNADKLEKQFAIRSGERLVFIKNGVLVTDRSVYDLKTHTLIASFGESFTDAVITENGYVFKSLSNSKIEIVNNENTTFSSSTAAQMLNAASCNKLSFGEAFEVSAYESNAALPEGTDVIGAVLPEKSKLIFAISASKRTLYRISCETLQVVGQIALRYEPAAICTDGKNIYVSFKNENLFFSYSISNNQGKYYQCADKYTKLECSGGKLYALNDKGNLYAFSTDNLSSHAETVIKSQNVLSFACNNGFLYVHLKPVTVSMLYKISCENYTVLESTVTNANVEQIFTANGVVLVGNKAFDMEKLEQIYSINEQVRFAYGKYMITDTGLYRSTDGVLLGNCRVDFSTPMFDTDYNYYSIEADRITRTKNVRNDLETLPSISNINDGAVLDGPLTIDWSFGTAYLDGEPYTKGTPVENGGLHNFVVSLPFGVSKNVQFTINADINYIVLTADKNTVRVNESTKLNVNAHPFTYGVVDVVYTTDNDHVMVLPDGSIIGTSVGDCTVTATTADGEHKATVKIKVTEGFIDFDSSYFFADSGERLVKGIAAGTDVEAFLIAASRTKGNLVVRGFGDVEVTAGMIHTGMRAELYDVFGKVIDSWELSVLGDIDGDGYITANDYYALDKAISHPESFTKVIKAAADIDSNGVVNAFDLLALKEHLLGQNDIGGVDIAPSRVSNATAHIIMPKSLNDGSSFTATLTLSEMKQTSAVSGLLSFDSKQLTLKEVTAVGKDGGFCTKTADGVYFFTDIESTNETAVVLILVFTVSDHTEVGDYIAISCDEIRLYDGSAATINGKQQSAKVTESVSPEVLIHNLPDYVFDKNTTENRLSLPAYTQNIYVSAYPMEASDIAGETSFGNRLNTSFAAVFTDKDGNITQYNYECEKSEASPPSSGATEVYKNNNTYLASITVSGGVLSPAFDKNVTEYYVVAMSPEAVSVEATPESVLSLVAVSEYDTQNGIITVSCTAEDGSVGNYVIRVCTKLPISYPKENNGSGALWLWCIPAFATVVLAGVFIVYKKRQKENEEQSERFLV